MKDILIQFLDEIRAYTRESNNNLAYDERDSSEIVDIFLKNNNSALSSNNASKLKQKQEEISKIHYDLLVDSINTYAEKNLHKGFFYHEGTLEEGLITMLKKDGFKVTKFGGGMASSFGYYIKW